MEGLALNYSNFNALEIAVRHLQSNSIKIKKTHFVKVTVHYINIHYKKRHINPIRSGLVNVAFNFLNIFELLFQQRKTYLLNGL